MVRHLKPRKIVEIGSRHSTRIEAAACLLNERDGAGCEFVAIGPYRSHVLKSRMRPGAVPIDLGRGDLLDEMALHAALVSGRLFGAGHDVYREEPYSGPLISTMSC